MNLSRNISTLQRQFQPRTYHAAGKAIARYEMKYLVDIRLIEPIREFLSVFCKPDAYGKGTPPTYDVTTLQFDSPWQVLFLGKEDKAMNRFKLRARTYGDGMDSPLFFEIKRKLGDVVVKSRAVFGKGWEDVEELVHGNTMSPLLKPGNEIAFLEFKRLIKEIGASPVMLLRYKRESYMSENDDYARVTFDSNMEYLPSRGWGLKGPKTGWRKMDTATALNREFPAFILELKTGEQMPTWMSEVIERFNLMRTDFCKYATAVRLEYIHKGVQYSDASEHCFH